MCEGICPVSVSKGALSTVGIATRAERAVSRLHTGVIDHHSSVFYRSTSYIRNFPFQRRVTRAEGNCAKDQISCCKPDPFPHESRSLSEKRFFASPHHDLFNRNLIEPLLSNEVNA
jgi:hypothetical protein